MGEGEEDGEGKVKVFVERIPILEKLCVDVVDYSKEMQVCRRRR